MRSTTTFKTLIQTLNHFTPKMRVSAKLGTSWDSGLFYHRLESTLSCRVFPSFGPDMLKAGGFKYSLCIYEENRFCITVFIPMPTLRRLTLLGEYCRLENS